MTRYDAIVIGARVNGLAAAALLAKSGARVLLLEKRAAPPEPQGPLFALDPVMVQTLQLAQHGLVVRRRDLKLAIWDHEEPPLLLSRDSRATARALARVSRADAAAWGPFQADLMMTARRLRRWWFKPDAAGSAEALFLLPAARRRFAHDSLIGADALLARHFETPRLVAALLQDALLGGLAPSEPGSALALVWRAAQQAMGLDGAVALTARGSLVGALKAACGPQMRFAAPVTEILGTRDVAGVRLGDGEVIEARTVLSTLTRARTEALAGLDRPAAISAVGEAQIRLTLADGMALPPLLEEARAVLALQPEDYVDAHEAARAGRLPSPLLLALVAEDAHTLVMNVPLAPVAPTDGWAALQAPLAAAAVRGLRRHLPGLAGALTGVTVTPPRAQARAGLAQLLAPAPVRAGTRMERLYLCGEDAEPVPCVSGRAGRFAAYFAGRALQ